MDFIKIKSFYASKAIDKKVKIQTQNKAAIFVNHVPGNRPISRSYEHPHK